MGLILPPPAGLRLASYNVRKAVGLDRRRDPGRILDVLAGLQADVVVLQEADLRLGARASAFDPDEIRERTGLTAVDLDPESPSLGWHGNALLVRDGIGVEMARGLDLPALEPRGAILSHLVTPAGPLWLAGAHLGLTRQFRRRQAGALSEELRGLANGAAAILGDFNEWRPVGALDALEPEFQVIAPGHSFHATWPVAPLDRVALGPGLRLNAAGVVEKGAARRASDHLPIWADVVLE